MSFKKSIIILVLLNASILSFVFAGNNENKNLIGKTVISTVDNLRMRDTPDLNSKVTGYLNKGEKAVVKDISPAKMKVKNKEDYWYKVKIDNAEGWVFGGLITEKFQTSNDGSVVLWQDDYCWEMDDEDAEPKVYSFNRTLKQPEKSKRICGDGGSFEMKLSPDGKFFTELKNYDGDAVLEIYSVESMKVVNKFSIMYRGKDIIKWIGNSRLELNEIVYKADYNHCCTAVKKIIFDEGKIVRGDVISLLNETKENCCSDVYKVSVSIMNIYDQPGGNGKVICTLKKDEYVNKNSDELEGESLTKGKSEWIMIGYYQCYPFKGYVLKKELKKAE